MKECTKCKVTKARSEFSAAKAKRSGLQPRCKQCQKEYRDSNKHKIKARYEANKEEINAKSRAYYAENREACLAHKKDYYEKNRDSILQYAKENQAAANLRHAKRWREDSTFRASRLLRARIAHAARTLRQDVTCGKKIRLSMGTIKARIEFNFQPGMSWENYGEWQIDHVKPVAAFAVQGLDVNMANMPCNLKPIWKKDNVLKSSTFKGVFWRYKSAQSDSNEEDKG